MRNRSTKILKLNILYFSYGNKISIIWTDLVAVASLYFNSVFNKQWESLLKAITQVCMWCDLFV